MPVVLVTGTGTLDDETCGLLQNRIVLAISKSMPCKATAVTVHVLSEQGKEKFVRDRVVFANIVTGFLNGKRAAKARQIAKRVKEATEEAIRETLPGIHFAEAFILKSQPVI